MLRKPFDKSKLPSRHVTEGPERAPHRSYMYAMGVGSEEIHQPLIGVATCAILASYLMWLEGRVRA